MSQRVNFFFAFITQDGLRRRMDKLRSSIEEANQAVDKEREKNVSLLHMIFPPDIAKRLWLGKRTRVLLSIFFLSLSLYLFAAVIKKSVYLLVDGLFKMIVYELYLIWSGNKVRNIMYEV